MLPFASLLNALAAVPGVERLRYTSPHPLFFDDALCRAHAELPALCPHVHLPLQSGSDRVLARMRRRYSAREYLALVRKLYAARADLALTTDLIVGFPGETRADFEATLALVREANFTDAYAFKYSPRPGTTALELDGAVDPAEAQARLCELQELQRGLTIKAHRARVGSVTTVLVEGPSAHAQNFHAQNTRAQNLQIQNADAQRETAANAHAENTNAPHARAHNSHAHSHNARARTQNSHAHAQNSRPHSHNSHAQILQIQNTHTQNGSGALPPASLQLRGRDPYHRVVNFSVDAGARVPRAGEMHALRIVCATPHSLIGELRAPAAAPARPATLAVHNADATDGKRGSLLR